MSGHVLRAVIFSGLSGIRNPVTMERTKKVFSLSRSLAVTGLAVLCLSMPVWAADGDIRAIRFDEANHRFLIEATGAVKGMANTVNVGTSKRVIIDIDNAEISADLPRDSQLLRDLSARMPGLRNITVNQYSGNGRPVVRILLDIDRESGAIRLLRNQGPRLELEIAQNNEATPVANTTATPKPTAAPPPQYSQSDTLKLLEEQRKQIVALQEQINRLKASNNTSEANELELLRTQIDNLNRKYEALAKENRQLKDRVSTTAQTTASITTKPASSSTTADTALRAQLTEAQRKISILEHEKQQLKSQLDQIKPNSLTLDDMKRTLVVMNQKYEQLQNENRDLKSQLLLAQSQAKKAASTPDASAKQAEIERLKQDVQSLHQQLRQAQTARENNPALEEMQRTLVSMNQRYDQLLAENKRLRAENEQLQIKPRTSNANSISDADLQKLRQQLTSAQQSLNESIRTINEQNKEIAYLRNQVANVKSGMDASMQTQLEQLRAERDAKEARIKELEQRLASKPAQTGGQSEVASLRRQLYQMTQQAEALAQQFGTKVQQLQERERTLLQARDEAKSQAEQLQAQVNTLQAQLAEASRKSPSISKTNSSALQAEISRLTEENRALNARLSALSESESLLKTLKDEVAQLTMENQALKVKSSDADLQERLASLQTELNSLTARYEKAVGEAQAAKRELENQKKLASKPAAGSALQSQVNELNRQLASLRSENNALREQVARKVSSSSPVTSPKAEQAYQEGKTALSAGNLKNALDKFKEAQLLEPDNARYNLDYSIALVQDHQYAEAADLLRRYLQRNPADREAYGQLGKIYLLNDQTEMATQALSRAIPIGTLNNYATALKKAGKNEDAENIFKMALKLNPNDSEVLFNLGNLYNATDRTELARNSYLQAIQIKPDFAEAHYNLGLVYSKLGERAKAAAHLEKYLQLSPGVSNAETIRAYIERLKS